MTRSRATSDDTDTLVRLACRSLFESPSLVEHVRVHRIERRFEVAPHEHDDLIQLDWIVDCAGTWTTPGGPVTLLGQTHTLIFPRTAHGFRLEPTGPRATAYNLRLRPTRELLALRPFAGGATRPTHAPDVETPVESTFRQIWRSTHGPQTPLVTSLVAQLLCRWPGLRTSPAGPAPSTSTHLRDYDAVVRRVDETPDAPPGIDELARLVHLSPRHFTREFRAVFGIAPKQFIDQRRLAHARQLLGQHRTTPTETADRLGFTSLAAFSRWFTRLAGMAPSKFVDAEQAL